MVMTDDLMSNVLNEILSENDMSRDDRGPAERTARDERRLAYLQAAAQLVLRDGFDGLTMGALAKEVGAAIGTTYGYFESKDEILAELQLVSMDVLVRALDEAKAGWLATLAGHGLTATQAAIVDVMLFTEFFVQAPDALPEEFRLQQMQLASPDAHYEPSQLEALSAAGRRMVATPLEAVIRLSEADRRFEGDSLSRTFELVLGLNGIALVRNLSSAREYFDVPEVSRRLTSDILVGWGATRVEVEAAVGLIGPVVEAMPLTAFDSHTSKRLANLSTHASV